MVEAAARTRAATARGNARRGRAIWLLVAGAVLLLGGVGTSLALDRIGVTPRVLAPWVERRTSGHNPAIVAAGRLAGRTLLALDRGTPGLPADLALTLGAQPAPAGAGAAATIEAGTPEQLRATLAKAAPGDVITLLPGTYRFMDRPLDANRPGRTDAPITVRAARPGSVKLEFKLVEGFRVSAPYWRFENLDIHGICDRDDDCEHAFHVVGAASHFAAVNNRISDFNAHFKINGQDGRFPDDGLIESNTLTDTHVRATANPVTPIDLVAASRWTIRANLISDFIKGAGDQVSYGAFAKGAGSANLFERNVVWCEHLLQGQPGHRVGLSLGGGGTGHQYCRDGRCITEQDGGIVRANLIAACSDVGIYLNSASASQVRDNTLVDTSGIDVRFASSSAQLDGNLVDGPIRSRDGGLLHLGDNLSAPLWQAYAGYHPVRRLFVAPQAGDFTWHGDLPLRAAAMAGGDGLCGSARRAQPAYGAFDSFKGCQAAGVR